MKTRFSMEMELNWNTVPVNLRLITNGMLLTLINDWIIALYIFAFIYKVETFVSTNIRIEMWFQWTNQRWKQLHAFNAILKLFFLFSSLFERMLISPTKPCN